jgi:hypothetical protein
MLYGTGVLVEGEARSDEPVLRAMMSWIGACSEMKILC